MVEVSLASNQSLRLGKRLAEKLEVPWETVPVPVEETPPLKVIEVPVALRTDPLFTTGRLEVCVVKEMVLDAQTPSVDAEL